MIGTFVWDVIHGRDAGVVRRAPVEEWGGITYALAAFDAALPPDWQLVPIVKVGDDLAERAQAFLRSLPRVAPDAAPMVVPYPNNRVELVYRDEVRRVQLGASSGHPSHLIVNGVRWEQYRIDCPAWSGWIKG